MDINLTARFFVELEGRLDEDLRQVLKDHDVQPILVVLMQILRRLK
jgi:hypothetical protein